MHQSFHSTQTWTFKQRTQTVTSSNKPSVFPGPTNYRNQKISKNYGRATVGNQKREVFSSMNDSPGPAKYLSKSYISEGPKQTISERHSTVQDITPCPQTYEAKYYNIVHKSPVYSIGTRQPYLWAKRLSGHEPAPCTYNPEIKQDIRSSKIGNSKRKDLSDLEKTPGPAAYQTTQSLIQKKEPRTLFGSAMRKSVFDEAVSIESPGPGKYSTIGTIQNNSVKRKGYTMRSHTADLSIKYKSKIPGPGKYNTNYNLKSQRRGYTYGTDQRITFIDDVAKSNYTPAPGTYTSRDPKKLKTYSFSSSKRKDLSDCQKTPGPAVYNTLMNSINIRTKAPGYSIGRGEKGLDKVFSVYDENPSSFNYSPSYELIKESSRMSKLSKSKWLKEGKGLQSPGVGTYNLDRSSDKGSKFTKQKRKSFTDINFYKDMPSPSSYTIKQSIPNPPKYMLSGMHKRKR